MLIDSRKLFPRLENAVNPEVVNTRCVPYPGSFLGERSGCIDNAVTDLVPWMVSYTDLEFMVVVMAHTYLPVRHLWDRRSERLEE